MVRRRVGRGHRRRQHRNQGRRRRRRHFNQRRRDRNPRRRRNPRRGRNRHSFRHQRNNPNVNDGFNILVGDENHTESVEALSQGRSVFNINFRVLIINSLFNILYLKLCI